MAVLLGLCIAAPAAVAGSVWVRPATKSEARQLTATANSKRACGFEKSRNRLSRTLVTNQPTGDRIDKWARGYFTNPGTDGCWIVFSQPDPLPGVPASAWDLVTWGSAPCEPSGPVPPAVCRALRL